MSLGDDAQRLLLLFGWYLALGLDVGGLLRHGWRLAQRQGTLMAVWVQADPDYTAEARAHRNREIYRCLLKGGLIFWTMPVLAQRSMQGDTAPMGWFPWAILGAHYYLLTVLYVWTEKDR